MGDMDLIPPQTKLHSRAETSDVGRRCLSLGPKSVGSPLELMQTLDAGEGEGTEWGATVGKAGRTHTPTELMLGCFTENVGDEK